jgi:hypothetical protein
VQDPNNIKSEYGISDFDIASRFAVSSTWNVPFLRNRHDLVGRIAGGWIVSNIITLQTGLPFTPSIETDPANTGTPMRPERLGSGILPNFTFIATRQVYHFADRVGGGSRLLRRPPGRTLSAFQGPSPDALVIVGVKQGGPNHFRIELPETHTGPASWDLYETTRELDCQRVLTLPARGDRAEIDLPAEAVFTLVGRPDHTE